MDYAFILAVLVLIHWTFMFGMSFIEPEVDPTVDNLIRAFSIVHIALASLVIFYG